MSFSFQNLSIELQSKLIINSVSGVAKPGKLLLLRGVNGSGKTTLLKALAGLMRCQCGDILLNDKPLSRDDWRPLIAYVGHKLGLKSELTIIENIQWLFAMHDKKLNHNAVNQALQSFNLYEKQNQQVCYLSQGQQKKTMLSYLVSSAKPIWLLDEPFSNLDDHSSTMLMQYIANHLHKGGICIAALHESLPFVMEHTTLNLSEPCHAA